MTAKTIDAKEQMRDAAIEYNRRQREAAFLSLDLNRILGQLVFERQYKLAFMSLTDEKGFWAAVHAIRLTAMSLDAQARKTSIDWMQKNGYQEWLKAKGIKAKG